MAALVVAAAGCGNGAPSASSSSSGGASVGTAAATISGTPAATIKETDALKFEPSTADVKVGDIVEFINSGTVQHNATFDSPADSLSSQTMQGNDTWEVKFSTAGTYAFHCTFHLPGMTGSVKVS